MKLTISIQSYKLLECHGSGMSQLGWRSSYHVHTQLPCAFIREFHRNHALFTMHFCDCHRLRPMWRASSNCCNWCVKKRLVHLPWCMSSWPPVSIPIHVTIAFGTPMPTHIHTTAHWQPRCGHAHHSTRACPQHNTTLHIPMHTNMHILAYAGSVYAPRFIFILAHTGTYRHTQSNTGTYRQMYIRHIHSHRTCHIVRESSRFRCCRSHCRCSRPMHH